MASVPNDVETLLKISVAWVGRTNVTDRQTDGRPMTYSEREHTLTNCVLLQELLSDEW